MASNFNEFMDEFNVHTSTSNSNPHKVSSKQIYGKDLTKLPWSASQGYSMNNTIDAYKAQDTSAL